MWFKFKSDIGCVHFSIHTEYQILNLTVEDNPTLKEQQVNVYPEKGEQKENKSALH